MSVTGDNVLYNSHAHFQTYQQLREQFVTAACKAGMATELMDHPLSKRFASSIGVDVATIGPSLARRVVFLLSGVHGTELHSGSAAQISLMREFVPQMPDDCRLVLVHAVNAFGCATFSRTDEDNIDPNRNVFGGRIPLPYNAAYEALHDALCPSQWHGPERVAADTRLAAYVTEHGLHDLTQNVLRGQHSHPDGLFYGGRKPSWTISALSDIFDRHGAGARKTAVIDIHTGVGPKGHGERIRLDHPLDRDAEWSGIGRCACELIDELDLAHPPIKLILEFGTRDFMTVLNALRADNWLRHYGDPDSPLGVSIKNDLKSALFVDEPEWIAAVTGQTIDCLQAVLAELQ